MDEINRLAETSPELADVLLDVMGTKPGRVQIEETGLPVVEVPVVASVWAASNPDEDPGPLEDIRRQLSDRFDLLVAMGRPVDQAAVAEILADSWADVELAHEEGGTGDGAEDERVRERLHGLAGRVRETVVPDALRRLLAEVYTRFSLESLRAVEGLLLSARLAAVLTGAREVGREHLARVAPLVLRHRVEPETATRIYRFLEGNQEAGRGQDEVAGVKALARSQVASNAAEGADVERLPPADGFDGLFARVKERFQKMIGLGPGETRPPSPAGYGGANSVRPPEGPGTRSTRTAPRSAGPGGAGASPGRRQEPAAPPLQARRFSTVEPERLVRTEDEL